MIYLDSSVALAHILGQPRRPEPVFWEQPIVSSRLLQYEVWNRVHAYGASSEYQMEARAILRSVGYHEMSKTTLTRALQPFPMPVRTLDGLHAATMDRLRDEGLEIILASYDHRLIALADVMGFAIVQP